MNKRNILDKKENILEVITYIFIFIVTIIMYFASTSIPIKRARTFPQILIFLIAVFSLIMIYYHLSRIGKFRNIILVLKDILSQKVSFRMHFLKLFLPTVCYYLLIEYVNYYILSIIYITFTSWLLGFNLAKSTIISTIVLGIIYLLLLKVPISI